VKKYITPQPGPTPKPGKDESSDRIRYKPPFMRSPKPKPEPTPKPKKPGDRVTIMPVKPKPKKSSGVKRRDVSSEQIKPRRIKPTPSRRRFLDELNEMNKRGGK